MHFRDLLSSLSALGHWQALENFTVLIYGWDIQRFGLRLGVLGDFLFALVPALGIECFWRDLETDPPGPVNAIKDCSVHISSSLTISDILCLVLANCIMPS